MSTAMRSPAKVQSLRAHEIDGGEKNAGSQTHLARAVTLHLAGKREEALKQLQRAMAANEASAEIYRAMGHIQFELGNFEEAAQELPHTRPGEAAVRHGLVQPGRLPGARWATGTTPRRPSTTPPRWTPRTWRRTLAWACATCGWKTRRSALFAFERCLELSASHTGRAVRQGGGAAIARPSRTRRRSSIRSILGTQSGFRRIALQPDTDRHGEGRLRHGAGVLRAPARTAAGIHRRAGGPGAVGLRGGRPRPDREVLHPAGVGGAGPLRGLVQPGAGAPEIGALASRPPKPTKRPSSCAANRREATPTWASCASNWATPHGARAAYERAVKANPDALAPHLEPGAAAGALRPARRSRAVLPPDAGKALPREEEARFRLGYPAAAAPGLPRRRGGVRRLPEVSARMARSPRQPGAGLQRDGRAGPCRTPVREDARSRSEVGGRAARPGCAWQSRLPTSIPRWSSTCG